jgi:uncharacterized protein (DUF1499 family)
MINRVNTTERKNVVRYQTQTVVEPKVVIETIKDLSKVVSTSNYLTDEETMLIIKNVDECEVTLNSQKSSRVVVKSLTTVVVKSDVGKIDEDWDELLLEKGACVQFQFVEGNWYITSSDGLKLG